MRINSTPENLLLRTAHHAKRSAWQLKHVVFDVGEQLWTIDAPASFALFPLRGVVSLQVSGDRGKRANIALLGREGCAEIPLLLGAARVLKRPLGTTSVLSRIARKKPGAERTPEIASRSCRNSKINHAGIPADRMTATVKAGWVTLKEMSG